MLKTEIEKLNTLLDESTINSYTEICKKFAEDTSQWGGLDEYAFYTTDGSNWKETPDNAHNGIDVSWAFNLTPQKIEQRAPEELYDTLMSEFLNGDSVTMDNVAEKVKLIQNNDSKTNSSITKFTITPLQNSKNNVVAVASATFYDTLTVNSITIRKGQNDNLYVKMPQKLTQQGNYIDVIHPLNSETRKNINDTLLNAYKSGNLKQEFISSTPSEISAQNSVKYEKGKYGNNLARLDIVVNDMVVHNCKIINGKDNKPFFSMPTYKDKNGDFHSIVTPSNSEVFKTINNSALNEYNTDYTFVKCDDKQLASLKEADIKFTSHKNTEGENVVKFKTSELQKVNSTLSSTPSMRK